MPSMATPESALRAINPASRRPVGSSSRDYEHCRRGEQTDAIGWLKLGPMDTGGTVGTPD